MQIEFNNKTSIEKFYCKKWTYKETSKLKKFLKKNNFPDYRINRIIWTLFQSPIKKGIFVSILESSNLVAFSYVIPRNFILNKKKYKFIETGEHFTNAKYRKKGLFDKILKNSLTYRDSIRGFITTPNLSSRRAYEKLGYKIFDRNQNRFLTYDPKKNKIKNNYYKNIKELRRDEYFKITKNFRRLNEMNKKYFDWRFGNPEIKYHFYEIFINEKLFYCAFRLGLPSPDKKPQVNVIAEAFFNESKPKLIDMISIIDVINNLHKIFTPTTFIADIESHSTKWMGSRGVNIKGYWLFYKDLKKASLDLNSYQLSDSDYG